MKSNKGFSLVELIVVIAIMAIIAAVAIPVYSNYVTKAEDAVNLQQVNDLVHATKIAKAQYGTSEVVTYTVTDNASGDDTVTLTFTTDKAATDVRAVVSGTGTGTTVTITLKNEYNAPATGDSDIVKALKEVATEA